MVHYISLILELTYLGVCFDLNLRFHDQLYKTKRILLYYLRLIRFLSSFLNEKHYLLSTLLIFYPKLNIATIYMFTNKTTLRKLEFLYHRLLNFTLLNHNNLNHCC